MTKIADARKELGKTQAQVAKEVGVSLSAYLLWERGVGKPNAENEKKLKEVLKLK